MKELHSSVVPNISNATTTIGLRYHKHSRFLHWAMALGFVLMWFTGVLVANIEGVPYFVEEDRQGLIRDLHKSIGYTLLGLLIARIILKFLYSMPSLPDSLPTKSKAVARLGHGTLYFVIVIVCLSGMAIADLQAYGNSYFGIELPQIFPTREFIAGWAVTPWSYVLHALLAYGFLALVVGHILAIWLHARSHQINLLPRILRNSEKSPRTLLRLTLLASCVTVIIVTFSVRGFVTLGQLEEPRDYKTTTPFSANLMEKKIP